MTPSQLRLVRSDAAGTDATHHGLRERALTCQPAELGLARAPGRPVWGIVMETGSAEGVTTLVATDDGGVSLFGSGGTIQLAKDDWLHEAGARFMGTAGDCLFDCVPAWAFPLPDEGRIRFYLLTFDGVMTAEAPEVELAAGGAPLSSLYYAGHDVLTLARLVSEEPDWAAFEPADASADAPKEIEPPVRPSARVSLLQAAARNDVGAVTRLLAVGSELAPDATGRTPLMAAAYVGAAEPLRLLLAAGAPVDVRDDHGFTALMLACNAGHAECTSLLIEAGADVGARDNEDSTPIIFAAQHGHDAVVRLLLKRGADPTALSGHGLSAIGFATRNGFPATVAILLGQDG